MKPIWLMLCWSLVAGPIAIGAPPSPVLSSVFPSGAQTGTTVVITLAGNLNGATSLRSSLLGLRVEPAGANQFRLSIPSDTPLGQYDLQAVTANGLSSLRTFVIGNRVEPLEVEPNNSLDAPQALPLDVVVSGRIDKGDLDHFAFTAQRGQRVVIECQAERIESRLRAVLELFDASGRRLAVNRGYFGVDPLIDFVVPADGIYVVKLFDLVFSGSAEHFYRLAIDTGPRVAFALPSVIERGKATRVTLHGWNLTKGTDHRTLDSVAVEITPPEHISAEAMRLRSNQVTVDGFAYQYPGSDAPILMGVSDVPVVSDRAENHSPNTAQEIAIPCEVSGQLIGGAEQDWFAINVRRGEVLWLEAFGERIGSPLDLELGVFDATSEKELANFRDDVRSHESSRFPSSHVDPVGRWIAPADGRFLILMRNVIGGLDDDPRRLYRLSVRRETPDFQLVAIPRVDDPTGWNVARGGRLVMDVLAYRRRGLTEAIRVSAKNLPAGIECPDIWLGPGVDSVPLVITAGQSVEPFVGALQLDGYAEPVGTRRVRGGTIIHKGPTGISSRITDEITVAVTGDAPVKLTANGHEPKMHQLYGELKVRHAPGSILDIAVEIERRELDHQAPVRLIGIGLPDHIKNQTAIIPAGKNRGTVSFYLPPTMPVGKYTLAVQGETTVPETRVPIGPKDASGKQKTEPLIVASNSVTIDVQPAAFVVEVDSFAPRKIRRGEIVQLNYSARRINGFLSKIHTELGAASGAVIGLRGRGVTFVGQTDTGTIQIVANEDAPLGQQPFLRLYGVGTLEDQPVFQGSCFLDLEIVP